MPKEENDFNSFHSYRKLEFMTLIQCVFYEDKFFDLSKSCHMAKSGLEIQCFTMKPILNAFMRISNINEIFKN